jgi:hypothetical protein
MDAPLDKDIKKMLADKEAAKKLMQAAIAGARNGHSGTVTIDGKTYKIAKTKTLDKSTDSDSAL